MATTPEVVDEPPEGDALPCPECGELIGPKIGDKGTASAKMMLGVHRRNKHGVKGAWNREKQPPQASESKARPLSPVRDIASAAGTGKRAPTAAQLTAAGGKFYGYVQAWRVTRLVDSDPRLNEQQRGDRAAELAPTAAEAEAVASPFARALAKTKLNQTAGRAIVENVDVLDCLFALMDVERRLSDYRREIKAHTAGVETGAVRPLVGVAPGDVAPGATAAVPLGSVAQAFPYIPDVDGWGAAAEQLGYLPAGAPHTEPGTEGRVIGAADVARSLGIDLPPMPADINTGVSQTIPAPSVEVAQ